MSFRVRPGKSGVSVRLHDLEAEVMDVVWSRELKGFAVSDVHAVLEKRREIAYTTVMTILGRLYEKGVVLRYKDGKRYLYDAQSSREEFLQQTAREVLERLGEPAGKQSLALLVETVSASDDKALDELEWLIKQRRKELGS
ncbi:MAG: hypothetical protein RJA70_3859 [Pseudomonadota bacterium]|jgi:predicted transcriptional regulator